MNTFRTYAAIQSIEPFESIAEMIGLWRLCARRRWASFLWRRGALRHRHAALCRRRRAALRL